MTASITVTTRTQIRLNGYDQYYDLPKLKKALKKRKDFNNLMEVNHDEHEVVFTFDGNVTKEQAKKIIPIMEDGFKLLKRKTHEEEAKSKAKDMRLSTKMLARGILPPPDNMDKHAMECYRLVTNRWEWGVEEFHQEDFSMSQCYFSDSDDLHAVLVGYLNKDEEAKKKRIHRLDTCVRETIPDAIYCWYEGIPYEEE